MTSVQAGSRGGTQDTYTREHPSPRPQPPDSTSPNFGLFTQGPAEVDQDFLSPEVRELLEQGALQTGLEVDNGDDGDDEEGDEAVDASSVYAISMYPVAQPSRQLGRASESGQDSATISSSRTLYADDVDFVVEHGRQYCGDYFLPVDQTEQTRQYVIHQVYLKLFDLELTTVPLENPRYILDIGTGIGEWAIGMAERYPRCEVFGTDIAPIQPTHQVPFNVEFHIENAEDEWIRPADTVDLVHLRNMEGAFSDWRFIYSQAYACIRPGGWIEVIDWEDFFADKNFLCFFPEGSAPRTLVEATLEAAEISGKPRGAGHLDRHLLIEAGFVDIQETVYDLGIGSRENNNYGKFWLFSIVTGIEAHCLRLLTKYLGRDAQETRDLCERVAREIKTVADDLNRVEAFVVRLRVLAARKPLVPGQWTARALNENGEIKADDYSGDDSTIGGEDHHTVSGDDTRDRWAK